MRSKRNIRLCLSYDGTDFGGWQRQDNARTVQGELERALERMHGHPVPVVGAGRTDSGVHAMGQVSNFYTDIASIEAGRFVPALNKLMPRDVRALSAADADFDFHSRYDARLRRYRYFAICSPSPDPMRLRYCHHLRRRPDVEALNAAAALILGEKDFTAFSSAKDASANRSRYVAESAFRWEGETLVYEIAANAFLWRMVRSLVGSMLFYEAEARVSGRYNTIPLGPGGALPPTEAEARVSGRYNTIPLGPGGALPPTEAEARASGRYNAIPLGPGGALPPTEAEARASGRYNAIPLGPGGALPPTEAEARVSAAAVAERMAAALRSKDRSEAGPTAPAHGLFLWNVEYYSSPTRPGRGDYWAAGRGVVADVADAEADAPRMVPGIGPVGD